MSKEIKQDNTRIQTKIEHFLRFTILLVNIFFEHLRRLRHQRRCMLCRLHPNHRLHVKK